MNYNMKVFLKPHVVCFHINEIHDHAKLFQKAGHQNLGGREKSVEEALGTS